MLYIISLMAFVLLFIKISSLSNRISDIEKKLMGVPQKPASSNEASAHATTSSVNVLSTQPIYAQANIDTGPTVNVSDPSTAVIDWLKDNWLLKLGVFLILVGFGWFISYAFVHNWIGPIGRVTLGLVVGALLALFGTFRMEKNSTQGKLFLILGSALTVITMYAGHLVYGYFSPVVLLALVFLVCLYVATIALQFNMKNIAIYGLLIAYVSPFLVDSVVETKLIFSYLIVVSLASIWLATIKNWRSINAVSIFGFMIHAVPYIAMAGLSSRAITENQTFVLMSVFAMGFVYFFVSVYGAIKNQESANQDDVVVAIFDSALIIFATYSLVSEEIMSLVLAGWMIVFASASFIAFTYTQKEKFFYVYSLIAILLLVIATAAELDGSMLIYAFIIEGAIISIAGYLVTRKLDVGYALSALMIGPAIMALPSIFSNKWRTGIFHDDFGVLFVIGAVLFVMGLFYYFSEQESETYNDKPSSSGYPVLCIVGSAFLLILIWLSSGSLFVTEGTAILASLVIYTIIGISTYFYGLVDDKKVFKYYGGTLLILVVLRLLFVDIWNMELGARVVTFILIGVLFISTAFLGNKNKKVTSGTVIDNSNNNQNE